MLHKFNLLALFICCLLFSCAEKEKGNTEQKNTSDSIVDRKKEKKTDEVDEFGLSKYLNSVKGHKEETKIAGNFTGYGIDTLYVVMEYKDREKDSTYQWYDACRYYLKSKSRKLPVIELFGGYGDPMLVFEGDVDGDGKDEWGYLHTWINSQWRYYRIYNYDNKTKKWRFLYKGELLSTPEKLRASGLEIVEKGPRKGLIKINYYDWQRGIRDTIVEPTYTPITNDNE